MIHAAKTGRGSVGSSLHAEFKEFPSLAEVAGDPQAVAINIAEVVEEGRSMRIEELQTLATSKAQVRLATIAVMPCSGLLKLQRIHWGQQARPLVDDGSCRVHITRCDGGVREKDVHLQPVAKGLNSSFQLASVEDSVEEGLVRPSFLHVIADRDGDVLGSRSPGAGKLPGRTNPKGFHLQGQEKGCATKQLLDVLKTDAMYSIYKPLPALPS